MSPSSARWCTRVVTGKYVIVRTTITHIKPVAYHEAILAGSPGYEEVAS